METVVTVGSGMQAVNSWDWGLVQYLRGHMRRHRRSRETHLSDLMGWESTH